jgi:ribosomal-protein-alanine N-acetyltransferase
MFVRRKDMKISKLRIETQRLILRHMRTEDAEAFLKIFSDPLAMRYFNVIFDRTRMDEWVNRNLKHQDEYGFSLLTVVLKEDGEIIGDCGLETDTIDGQVIVGIGYDFRSSYWGKGYATEAALAVLEYGFANYKFDGIYAWIDPENKPSQRVAERIGMTVQRHVNRGGKKYALFAIKREDRG